MSRGVATVLVVDDTPETLSIMGKMLRAAGYAVEEADSGPAAVAMAAAQPPDLILLDVRMREMDGLEVCRVLKTREKTKDVPVILVSAHAEADERADGLALGASDYVTKPFKMEELLARVEMQMTFRSTLSMLRDKSLLLEQTNERLQVEILTRLKAEEEMLKSLDRAERSRRALLSALEDERRVQAELRQARRFLDSIIESIPNVVFIKDAEKLTLVRVNRAAEELIGIPRAELLGKSDHDIFPRSQADFHVAKDREALRQRAVVDIPEEAIQTRTKGERILHIKVVPIVAEDGSPAYILGVAVDITENKRAQDDIARLSARLTDILATVPEILMEVDLEGVYTWANEAGLRFFGDDVLGKGAADYFVGDQSTFAVVQPLFEGREDAVYVESLQRRWDGAHRRLAWWCRPLKDAYGRVKGALSSARDITDSRRLEEERRRLEEQLRKSQKMEAIGSLAGGVAHDFNNLICVLQSYTEFAIRGVRPDDPVKDDLLAVKRAGERAASLTRQLLAFGRRQVLQPVPLNVNDVFLGIEKMLLRILGEDVELVQVLAPDLGVVRADHGQLEQIFMNLAANARDAMVEGGRLTIATQNVELGEGCLELDGILPAGSYVQVTVTDTGCGMDEMTLGRIFEPFFTTKDKSKGTGLGLATVYGIVKQSKGSIRVESEVGRGTTFRICLPRDSSTVAVIPAVVPGQGKTEGTETILLVEDEEELRNVSRRCLEGAGYTVLCAGDGEEGVQVAERHSGEMHLLLTDVVMPKMGGRALAQKLKQTRPGTAILFMTGYTDDTVLRHGLLDAGTKLIVKPFTGTLLLQKVRETLDGPKVPRGSGEGPGRGPSQPRERLPAARKPEPISGEMLADIYAAATAARQDDLTGLIERLRPDAPAFAAELSQCVERFDYEAILAMLSGSVRGGLTS